MMMMFQSLDFFILSCFFLRVGCQTDKSLPGNVTICWTSDFHVQLSWAKAENCTYSIKYGEIDYEPTSPWEKYIVMNGACLPLHVWTVCNDQRKELSLDKCQEMLVKDVECYIHTSKQTFCSWVPVSNADIHFFYRLIDESGNKSANDTSQPPLQKCSYSTNNGRASCELQAGLYNDIDILFNATVNKKSVRNTFKIELKNSARPPAPNLNVTKIGDRLHLSWTPPDILPVVGWTYEINYTQCDKSIIESKYERTSHELEKSPNCRACVKIKARRGKQMGEGETPWSDEKCFGKDSPIALVCAAIIIPLVLGGLVVVVLVYCGKNKDLFFPKVPAPRDLISDISDNNNKTIVGKLYIPAEEEDNCKITLVMDPRNDKLNH